MKKIRNRQNYYRDFWARHRRVTITLSNAEFNSLKRRAVAGGRKPGQQLFAESVGYLNGAYVPTELMELRLQEIALLLRNEANNLNQLTRYSHTLKRLACDEQSILMTLQKQEVAVENLIMKSWRSPCSPEV